MKSSPKIIAVAVMILIFSVTVAAAAGSDSFDGFGVTLAELFSWDKPLAGENAIETDTDCAETDTDCRETDSDCESWTDAPPYFVSGQCGDNLYWSLDTGEKVLRISGTGAMYDYSPIKEAPWYEHRRYIKSIGIESGATSIGSYAFEDCPRLQSTNIPEGVESIGAYAFWDCINLESIAIPDSVTSVGNRAFYGCSGLQKAEIGSGLKKIPDYMFYECFSLTAVNLSEGIEEIGADAFNNSSLNNITIPNSVKIIGNGAFANCYHLKSAIIGNNVTTIDSAAFASSSLNEITIPNSVNTIASNAFSDCYRLQSVTIGNSVTNIGSNAFSDCDNLQSIVIPENVEYIEPGAFSDCDFLNSVTTKNAIVYLPQAFERTSFWYDNTYVNKIIYTGNLEEWCELTSDHFFDYTTCATELYIDGKPLKGHITIPDGVTEIGSYTFVNFDSITSISIPDSITRIGEYAFFDSNSLKNIIIPNSCKSIDWEAFGNCSSLRYIHIPYSTAKIGTKSGEYMYSNILDGTNAVICSNTEDCYAKEYADEFGIEFFVCGEEHTPMPDNIEKYHCESCDQNFWDIDSYKNHMNNYHYYCERCDLSFDDYYSYKKHIYNHEEDATTSPDALKPTQPITVPATRFEEATKETEKATWPTKAPETSLAATEIITLPEGDNDATTAAYICDYCGLRFGGKEQLNHHVSICGKGNGQGISVKIKTPSVSSVSYGDGIILHTEVSPLPEGMKYEWRASNTCFDMNVSDGGAFCTVTPRENGSTVFSIVVTDAEGNVVCESEPVVLKAKATIFDRIIAFFRNLFGLTKILPEMMK